MKLKITFSVDFYFRSSNVQPHPPHYGGMGHHSLLSNSRSYSPDYHSNPQYPQGLVPDGAFAPVYKPAASLTLTADFIELNCAANGRIQHVNVYEYDNLK